MRRPHANPIDEKITQLEWKLYQARETILALMPGGVQEILRSYRSCASRDDANQWNHTVVEKIISLAEELPSPRVSFLPRYAKCPLCSSVSMAPFQPGFALPEGLRRHLVGWGNARQCGVFNAVSALAWDCWNGQFSAAEEAERKAKQTHTASRKQSETLYRTAPDLEPSLIDEGAALYGRIPRDAASMVWAEQRLEALGFEIILEGAVKSYLSERGDFVVYADPRALGIIEFAAYKKPLPKLGRRLRVWAFKRFGLQDSWKSDIRGKYESRLAKLMASMSRRDSEEARPTARP